MRSFLLAGAALLALAACSATPEEVAGLVTDIETQGVGQVQAFTLRTEDGRELRFVIDGGTDLGAGGFPADHLREHMTTVTGVEVAYRTEGEQRIATKLTDADIAP
jgi:hypothetical protein